MKMFLMASDQKKYARFSDDAYALNCSLLFCGPFIAEKKTKAE